MSDKAVPGSPSLKQAMGLTDIVALGLSAAIGVSIFAIVAPATALAGPAVMISLLLAMLPMAVFVVIYAFMGSAVPRSGSSYAWPAQFVHPYVGFIVSWLRILGNVGALSLMATIFVGYLESIVTIPRLPATFSVLLVFYIVNMIGVGVVGRTAVVLVAVKLLILAAFIILGLPRVEVANFTTFAPGGVVGVMAALPLLVGLYSGIESAVEAGEEVRNSKWVIGRALLISAVISLATYIGVIVVTIGVLGAPATGESTAPLTDAGRAFLGSWMGYAVLATALVSIAAAINTLMLITTRFLFAMGRDGVLPGSLAAVHPRWGTPYVATTVTFVAAVAFLALPGNLVFLFLAANIPTVFKYGSNCLAAIGLVNHHPELHAAASFKLQKSTVRVWGWMGVLASAGILMAGINADWRSYALLLAWAVVGTLYWRISGRHRSAAMVARSVAG